MVVNMIVNATERQLDCPPGMLLAELLRREGWLAPDAAHVLLDGSCVDAELTLAFQARGREVTVQAGLAPEAGVPALTCAEVEEEALTAG